MPIVRVNDDGKKMTKWSRKVAMVSAGVVIAGLWQFFSEEPAYGLMLMIAGNSLAAIWNLADDS